jgi:putative endonuclease
MKNSYYVYILTNRRNGTLSIGITNNLIRRIEEHKNDLADGFTKKYGLHTLVHYEIYQTPIDAISREKQIKEWKRSWKLQLIEENNPTWKDLSNDF